MGARMSIQDIQNNMQDLLHKAQDNFQVDTWVGEPIQKGLKTIVPVAKVGFLEITEEATRFVKRKDNRKTLIGAGIAFILFLVALVAIFEGKKQQTKKRKPALW